MDLSQLDAEIAKDERGAVVTINQKNGDPYISQDGSPSTVTVLGSESKRYQDAKNAITKRALSQRRSKLDPADISRNRLDLACAAITDWSGWESGGKPAQCTPENVKSLLRAEHILEQVESAVMGHADFFGKPSDSLSQ